VGALRHLREGHALRVGRVRHVDDHRAELAALDAEVGSAAGGRAGRLEGGVGGVGGQHPVALREDLHVALQDVAVVDRGLLRRLGVGDVDDLQAVEVRAAEGVVAAADAGELDVGAGHPAGGVGDLVVGHVGDRLHVRAGADGVGDDDVLEDDLVLAVTVRERGRGRGGEGQREGADGDGERAQPHGG
jgi:hypothetical protein